MDQNLIARYQRQIIFPELGLEGQEALGRSRVAQVGCGGLGSTLAQCMVRAGVGKYTIIDKDVSEINNLHRQFLFDEEDAKQKSPKALAAARKLKQADSNVDVVGYAEELTAANVDRLLSGHDLVLDGADNLPTRYLINDWCVENRVPWIYGGVVGTCGMILVIRPGQGPCLRCLFPDPECAGFLPTTAAAGILNTAPVFIAALQSTEAIKLLIQSPALITDFRVFDLWTGNYQRLPILPHPACRCQRGKS